MNVLRVMVIFSVFSCEIFAGNSEIEEDFKLTRIDPVSVGHVQTLHLKTDKTLTIKTAAVHPPIFEIENFLTNAECDYIRELAESKADWKGSTTLPKKRKAKLDLQFKTADKNNDTLVDFLELWYVMPRIDNSMITVEDIPEFVQLYNYDEDRDERLTVKEFDKVDAKLAYEWTYSKMKADKSKLGRVSDQTWLSHHSNNLFKLIKERVVSLTGLPKRLIDASEQIQIVHYDVGGHYHAHFDTQNNDDSRACIHTREIDGINAGTAFDFKKYRVCRYITIMYYLNDVDEGGETAFPVADNETVSDRVMYAGGSIGDLSNHCNDARLVVKPKKGKAVLWYNHLLNEDGWLGKKDRYSYHGGCDIKQGVKWIANHWLPVDTDKERQIRYMDLWNKKYGDKDTLQQKEKKKQHREEL